MGIFITKINKKAQEGTKAATLVAIIAGLVLLYILFLPPAEREKLLEINKTQENITAINKSVEANLTLLLEHPGILEYIPTTEYEKSIPPLTLYTKTEAKPIQTAEAITVKSSWFSQQKYNLTFSISDLRYVDNILLSFNVDSARGNLIVEFNGNEIYNKNVKEKNVLISLPKNLLLKDNYITIKTSSVGISFWSKNEYQLSKLQLVADITDVSAQESKSAFILSSTEATNIETATLKFYVDCVNIYDLSKLIIEINNHPVYSQVPSCGSPVSQQISPYILLKGENTISFKTEFAKPTTAYYNIDNILLKLKLKETTPPTYYFDLTDSQFSKVKEGRKNIIIKLSFTEDVTNKKADIFINGIKTSLETKQSSYNKTISDQSKVGTNSIKIMPRSTFEVVDLEVTYEG